MVKTLQKEIKEKIKINGHTLTLSHLDKVFWEKEQYTKGDLLQFYHQIAPYILPYLKERPLVLHRQPQGIEGNSFYQKNIAATPHPDWIKTAVVQHSDKKVEYIVVQDEATLLYVVNLGCIELHPFNNRIKKLDNPDYAIFDLDPLDISFEKVIEVAQLIHDILKETNVNSYCKTSGSKGLHIYVPLGALYTYEQIKEFTEIIALIVHQQLPDITSLEITPAKRKKKIYIDTRRNAFGQTTASPYCVRPKPDAPVSIPLDWSEVKPGLSNSQFTIKNALERLEMLGDIFKPILGKGINIQSCLKKLQKSQH